VARTIVFDIEGDGFLQKITKMWVLCAYVIETKEERYFEGWSEECKEFLDSADRLVGHNIIDFDLNCLLKLYKYQPRKGIKITDTLIFSRILDYNRFGDRHQVRHSLEAWGEFLGFPKQEFSDWTQYTPKMLEYCRNDVRLNVKIWIYLLKEFQKETAKYPLISKYIEAEHAVAKWCAAAELNGWPFDIEKAQALEIQLRNEIQENVKILTPLGWWVKPLREPSKVRGIKGHVKAFFSKITKKGEYTIHTVKKINYDVKSAKYFPIDFEPELNDVFLGLSDIAFVTFETKELQLSSSANVKIYLDRLGWVPTQWNKNKETGERTSPKITEDSLDCLGEKGKNYTQYTMLRSRYGILKTWIENCKNGRIYGECIAIGTPSMRSTHKIIANIPRVNTAYGKEFRELFTSKKLLFGADSTGNQLRGLAHCLRNADWTEILLHGDIHTHHAELLTKICKQFGFKEAVTRECGKRTMYAFIFGAGGDKLFIYCTDGTMSLKGSSVKFKEQFFTILPGFVDFIRKLEDEYENNIRNEGKGYFRSLVGHKLYVDSKRVILAYCLQCIEKITMAGAVHILMNELEEKQIKYIPRIMYHDEVDAELLDPSDENQVVVKEACEKAFHEGPKLFGINIMQGSVKFGHNWAEIH